MTGTFTTQLVGQLGGGSFKFGMWDASGVGTGPCYNVHVLYDPATDAVVTPARDASLQAIRTLLGAPLTVTWGAGLSVAVTALPLPAGAATDASVQAVATALAKGAKAAAASLPVVLATDTALPLPAGAATDARLASIQAILQAQTDLATSLWTDGTGGYYVRREVQNQATGVVTVSFANPDGTASSVAASSLKPVSSDNALALVTTYFDVTGAATGIVVGDVLARLVVVNKAVSPPVASAAIWLNLTAGTTLAGPPAAGTYLEQTQHLVIASSALPAGAATDAGVQAVATALAKGAKAAAASLPVVLATDTALPLPAGAATDASVQAVATALAKGAKAAAASLPVVLATDTALPLPAGAATDASVQAVATALAKGAKAAAASLPVVLATDTALPLPAGAATDARLASIQAILQAQTDLATSLWTDGTGGYYVRREVQNQATGVVTVSFANPDGTASSVAASSLKPVSSDNALALVTTYFDVTGAATGIAVGDVLARLVVVNKAVSPPVASAAIWLNLTAGTTLAGPPAAGTYLEQTQHLVIASSALPAGAATDAGVQAVATALAKGAKAAAASLPVVLATDTALPLPAGAATDASVQLVATALAKGLKPAASSLSVVLASDGPFTTNFGTQGDAPATSDAGAATLMALFKRSLGYLSTLPTLAGAVVSGVFQVALTALVPRATTSASLLTQGAVLTLPVDTFATASVQIGGTWAGTASFLASLDGGLTFAPVAMKPFGAGQSGPSATAATANGQWEYAIGTVSHLRVQLTNVASGAPSVTIAAAMGPKLTRVTTPSSDPLPVLDSNNASYTTAGAWIASGPLPAPVGMPAGAVPRGIAWICDATTPANAVATVTLTGGGTRKVILAPNYSGDSGMSPLSVTAVTGATFQALY